VTARAQGWLTERDPTQLLIGNWTITEMSSAMAIKLRTGRVSLGSRAAVLAMLNKSISESFTVLAVGRNPPSLTLKRRVTASPTSRPTRSPLRLASPRLPETEKIKNQREQSHECQQDLSEKIHPLVSASFFNLLDCGGKHLRCRLKAIC
jgi:hypothetical protein